MKKILCVVGTRPEAIKMAPIIKALQKKTNVVCRVLATAQHRQMLDQVLTIFDIVPDIDLDIMQSNQQLSTLTARLLTRLDSVLVDEKPDVVLAQGDTTTVMTTALACFYHKIPFGHVEAGLRTHNLYNPFPEEANRIIAGHLATWHFAPTEQARQNLLREGIVPESIHVTGNTVIDALLVASERCAEYKPQVLPGKKLILVTAHRRENFGQPFINICNAILELSNRHEDLQFLFPVHPNPNISGPANQILGGRPAITLCEPLEYLPFVAAMKSAYFILTDSGGVQEEAPALGKPVLVLRNETERPEAVDMGVVKLVGSNQIDILDAFESILLNKENYLAMATGASPYGDGNASNRILTILGVGI